MPSDGLILSWPIKFWKTFNSLLDILFFLEKQSNTGWGLHAWQRKSKWKVFHSSARYNVCNQAGAYFWRSGLQQRHKQQMGLPKQWYPYHYHRWKQPSFFPENRNAFPYKIPGFTSDSPELVLTFNTPLMVATGQEYRLWFSEDLRDQHEDNNVGPSCTKVLLTMKKKLFTKKVIKWSGKRWIWQLNLSSHILSAPLNKFVK